MKTSPTQSMGDERRQDERHVVLVKVALRDEARLRNLYATNLSKGGLFLATRSGLPIGQEVLLRLVHPLTEASFEITARVVNVRRDRDGEIKGCGLQFTAFDEDLKEALFLFVEGIVELREEDEVVEVVDESADEDVQPPTDASPVKLQAHAFLLRALTLEKEGNLIGAAHLLARATSLDPAEDALWAALHRVEGQLESAAHRSTLDGDGSVAPGTSPPRARGGAEAAPSEAASKEARAGEAQEPSETDQLLELDEGAALEPADRRKARLLFEVARDCYRTREFDDAIRYLEHALGSDPTYAPPYYALAGLLAEERDEVERSLFLCGKAVELDPDNEVYREALDSLESLAKDRT